MKNYYYLLGIDQNADASCLKTAYRKLSLKIHPDLNRGDDYFTHYTKELNEAYEILSDPLKRSAYDQCLKDSAFNSFIDFEVKFSQLHKKEKEIEEREFNTIKRESDCKKQEKEIQNKEQILIYRENQANQYNKIGKLFMVSAVLIVIMFVILTGNGLKNKYSQKISNLETNNYNIKQELDEANVKIKNRDDSLNVLSTKYKELNLKNNALSIKLNSNQTPNDLHKVKNFSGLIKYKNNLKIYKNEMIDIPRIIWKFVGFEDGFNELYIIEEMSITNNSNNVINRLFLEYEIKNSNGKPIDSGEKTISIEPIPPGRTKAINGPFIYKGKRIDQIMELKISIL